MADRVLAVAPNWLGDAVMALPALTALRRWRPEAHMAVAARASVAPLFLMVEGVNEVITLETTAGLGAVRRWRRDAHRLQSGRFDVSLALPNSFVAAWILSQARIRERWGYAADLRARLLTRAIPRPRTFAHQADYYLALVSALGIPTVDRFARVTVPEAARTAAAALLSRHGLTGATPFVAMAPGAAYGKAKQWPPERFAALASLAHDSHGLTTVLIGTRSDAAACAEIVETVRRARAGPPPINLAGSTDLPTLAAVLAAARAVVANDSGAMHLGGAVGTPVVAVFGSTNEHQTAPLTAGPQAAAPRIVTHPVWCRPCMLRECPIDHRCMTEIGEERVLRELENLLIL